MYSRIKNYQQRFQRTIYFVNEQGQVVLRGRNDTPVAVDLRERPGLREIIDRILQDKNGGYQYEAGGTNHLLNVQYIPELKWYLFIEKDESEALTPVRQTLYINLAICLVITIVVLMLTNVSLTRYQRRIEEMAATDKLTGMLNRQAFDILMDKLMADSVRTPRPVSILMLDLDHFKWVNDQYGHAMGDRVLRRVAETLQHALRKSDIAVRWGDEEFLVVLDNCALDEARQIAEKIRERIAQTHVDVEGQPMVLSVSAGVSQLRGGEQPDQAIRRADSALYQAKDGGRNRVGVAD